MSQSSSRGAQTFLTSCNARRKRFSHAKVGRGGYKKSIPLNAGMGASFTLSRLGVGGT